MISTADHRVLARATDSSLAEEKPENESADALTALLNQASRYPLLTSAQEVDLAQRIWRGDMDAKDVLINSNLRLVVSVARRFRMVGMPMSDLVQSGVLGLIRAAEKFDYRKGFKFSTYAVPWITQAIQRTIANTSRPIRLPVHVHQVEQKIRRAERSLAVEMGREPTVQEIAGAAELSVAEVQAMRDVSRVTSSLDRPIGDDSDHTLGDLLASAGPPVEEEVLAADASQIVLDSVEQLPSLESDVIALRFGLAGRDPLTLAQTSAQLGLTVNQARTVERRALKRLRDDTSLRDLAA